MRCYVCVCMCVCVCFQVPSGARRHPKGRRVCVYVCAKYRNSWKALIIIMFYRILSQINRILSPRRAKTIVYGW